MTFINEKIRVNCEIIQRLIMVSVEKIKNVSFVSCDYKQSNTPPCEGWTEYNGQTFDKIDDHAWFKFTLDVPASAKGRHFRLSAQTGLEGCWNAKNPQCILYVDGETRQAFDTNHTWAIMSEGKHEIAVYYYTGMNPGTTHIDFALEEIDFHIEKVYYDLFVPYSGLQCLDSNSMDYINTLNALDRAVMLLDFRHPYSEDFYNGLRQCEKFLEDEFYGKLCGGGNYTMGLIGHTHIDVAWLWTIAQTEEKAQRSFATALMLMEKYPEYVFMSSQPQLYEYVKKNDPALYEKIKERVAEGRWEPEGSMWLEADTNIISGESLIRQILVGKRFFREEFGCENNSLWLPDVFGYSAALPQILKKMGVTRFFTAKISWNETDTFPHDAFVWQGIDGSQVFAACCSNYTSKLNPCEVQERWRIFKSKKYSDVGIMPFGFGDGGGGPTAEMLENYDRMKRGLPGFPKVEIKKSSEIIDKIQANFEKNAKELRFTPKWSGELYLEKHRGTYTSIAKNKKNNRRSEFLYQNAETASVIEGVFNPQAEYPYETLDKNWHTILKNQFHDIIPGSSIKAVYDDSDREYAAVLEAGNKIMEQKLSWLAANVNAKPGSVLVYNPAPFEADAIVDGAYITGIPAHGWKTVVPAADKAIHVVANQNTIENDLVKVTFDEKYHIVSFFDKAAHREVISAGMAANVLELFEDYPRDYDAWEINEYYKQKKWIADDVSKVEVINEGVRAGIRITRKYQQSSITQTITLTTASPRLDFATVVDWQEDHVLLKAAFPVDIRASFANYEIQFGHIERPTHRNTSWDEAKFEVCAHKWADLSEADYGVSLLNDCKYGYNTEENVMKITLLKAATYPNPEADRGINEFTYSLYPHSGPLGEATIRQGYLLNNPVVVKTVTGTGAIPGEYSLLNVDNTDFVVETIKRAENGNDIIVRGYEAGAKKCAAKLTFGFDVKKAYLCDLMENILEEIPTSGNSVEIKAGNFEIVTVRVEK